MFTPLLSLWFKLGKITGNNTALQGQEVQSLDISGTCFHPHSLYPSLYLLFQKQDSKPGDGWAELLQGFQKRTESDCCSTWGAKTKEPSLPVGLWESRLWSGPERESSLMKYWCFSFSFVLFFLTESCGSSVCSQDVCADPQHSSVLRQIRIDSNNGARGVLSALMGLMITPQTGPALVRDLIFPSWSKETVCLISQNQLQKTYRTDVCLTS